MRKSLRDSVKDIIHKVGVTSILVTHDQEEAFDIADKVVIFNRSAALDAALHTAFDAALHAALHPALHAGCPYTPLHAACSEFCSGEGLPTTPLWCLANSSTCCLYFG